MKDFEERYRNQIYDQFKECFTHQKNLNQKKIKKELQLKTEAEEKEKKVMEQP